MAGAGSMKPIMIESRISLRSNASVAKVSTIKEDFYGLIFLATLESILSKPAQAELTAQGAARACWTAHRLIAQ